MFRSALAELIGTYVLVFFGTAMAVAIALQLPVGGTVYGPLGVALVFGLVLAALVTTIGHISGAHVNPAVTLGVAVAGKFPWSHLPAYIVAQVAGAFLASKTVALVFGSPALDRAYLGMPIPASGITYLSLFLIEAVITFFLVLVVIGSSTDERAPKPGAGFSIGAALAIAVAVGGPISGGSANPARALGPMLAAGLYLNVFAYVAAPLIGGAVAALLYMAISPASTPKV